jgi:hypothetical protein
MDLSREYFDSKTGRWRAIIEEDGINHRTDDQLAGVLIEAQFISGQAAENRFAALMESSLFDGELELWNSSSVSQTAVDVRASRTQLLSIFVQRRFDKEQAQERLERLKRTPLYDKEEGKWVVSIDGQETRCCPRGKGYTFLDQLLGAAVEKRVYALGRSMGNSRKELTSLLINIDLQGRD